MNSKATFKVMFLIQKGKLKSNGNAPIMARITVNGEMAHFSTRMDIKPERWLGKEYRAIGTTKDEKKINALLDELKSAIIRRYYDFQSAGEVITASRIKCALLSLDNNSTKYIELCDIFIEDYKKLTKTQGYGKDSLNRYILLRNRLSEFISSNYKIGDIWNSKHLPHKKLSRINNL